VARQYFDSDSAYITILSVKRQDDSAIDHARLIGAALFIPAAGLLANAVIASSRVSA
jgi:hypothetical protein